MRIRNLGIAGMAAWFIAGSTGTAALAAPSEDSPGNSSASIGLNGCVLSSTKDISNIGYYSGGSFVAKDESMNTRSYDLSTVAGIENIDTVTVKAGTTVESFAVDCPPATAPDDGTGEESPGDGGSTAVITLSGCVLSSTKDISNIGYYSGGVFVAKDESMNTRSYDLSTVAGIENIDTVTVKAGTTVETFTIDCAPAT